MTRRVRASSASLLCVFTLFAATTSPAAQPGCFCLAERAPASIVYFGCREDIPALGITPVTTCLDESGIETVDLDTTKLVRVPAGFGGCNPCQRTIRGDLDTIPRGEPEAQAVQ